MPSNTKRKLVNFWLYLSVITPSILTLNIFSFLESITIKGFLCHVTTKAPSSAAPTQGPLFIIKRSLWCQLRQLQLLMGVWAESLPNAPHHFANL